MSIIDNTSKTIMVRAMRNVLENSLVNSTGYLSESKIVKGMNYVNESATYEQLLNLTFNPFRDSNYLPAHVLEGAAAILYASCLTGRSKIGPRAIAEGAMDLQNSTGCVITEAMLDAAYNAVKYGIGLQVIGESYSLITENRTDEIAAGIYARMMAAGARKADALNSAAQMYAKANKMDLAAARRELLGKFSGETGKAKMLKAGKSGNVATTLNIKGFDDARKLSKRLRDPMYQEMLRKNGASQEQINKLIRNADKKTKSISDNIVSKTQRAFASSAGDGGIGTNSFEKMPWYKTKAAKYGAIGLGALGAAGAGYGIYKWMKNKKKKNED